MYPVWFWLLPFLDLVKKFVAVESFEKEAMLLLVIALDVLAHPPQVETRVDSAVAVIHRQDEKKDR